MATPQVLKAHTRKRSGSAALNSFRREGRIPAVVYGKGHENLNIRLDRKAVADLLARSASKNILVTLEIEDRNENTLALVKALQMHPITGLILHMDFLAVNEGEPIRATIPLELVGESVGVKAGGLLEFMTQSIGVVCLPKALPESIAVDITTVGGNQSLHVSDLKMPEGVKATTDSHVTILKVTEVEAPEETPAASAKDAKGKAAKKAAKK